MHIRFASRAVLCGLFALTGCSGAEISQEPNSVSANIGSPNKMSPNCTLVVPDNALSAQGLATPYQIRTTNANLGSCTEAAANAAFVQATILDPATGNVSVYNPLVVAAGTPPAVPPVVPNLPANAVVGIWFGFNGDNLSLTGATNTTLANANCVNGLPDDIFGQVSFCNASQFFAAVNKIGAQKLLPPPPPLGTAVDGQTCPTVRNFFNVDQDPSDNVTTNYLLTANGLAQDTAANRKLFPNATALHNASDNRLLSIALDSALGCHPYTAPDLADPGASAPSQALNEISAALLQATPSALVPSLDPMVLTNGALDLQKQNLYRAGVDQPAEPDAATAEKDMLAYCQNMVSIAPARLKLNQTLFTGKSSPDPAAANNLFTFLCQRFNASLQLLNCTQKSPINVTFTNGVATSCSIN